MGCETWRGSAVGNGLEPFGVGAGYFAEEAYYFDRVRIRDMPKLSRGRKYVVGRSIVRGARFEPRRNNTKRGPKWDWDKNPFAGSRELNGLKVIMILLNNFDACSENNRVLYVNNRGAAEARYVVTDLGATSDVLVVWAESVQKQPERLSFHALRCWHRRRCC